MVLTVNEISRMASGSVEPHNVSLHLFLVAVIFSVTLNRVYGIEIIDGTIVCILIVIVELPGLSVVADVVHRHKIS